MVDEDRWLAIVYIAPRVARALLECASPNRFVAEMYNAA